MSRFSFPPGWRLLYVALILTTAGVFPACNDDSTGAPAQDSPLESNLLMNGSLENGTEPWFTLAPDSGFVVTDAKAFEGTFSALERMRDPASATGSGPTNSKVYYLVQEISPDRFPDVVRGHYFVENWVSGTDWLYLQFVIIASAPANFPASPGNYQIRYPLAGIDSQPFPIDNAKFKFVSRDDPQLGVWTPFEVRVKDDFEELWGAVPEDFEKLRLLSKFVGTTAQAPARLLTCTTTNCMRVQVEKFNPESLTASTALLHLACRQSATMASRKLEPDPLVPTRRDGA